MRPTGWWRPRLHVACLTTAISAIVVVLPAAAPAGASAAITHGTTLNLRRSLSGLRISDAPGVRSPAPSAQALSNELDQATGLTPSQVIAKAVCGPVPPGTARCAAQALHLRSSGALVRPHVHARKTFTQVVPNTTIFDSAAPPPAPTQSGPTPGTPAWLQQAYDLSYLAQTHGVGDTIAIVDAYDDPSAESDLMVYRATYGLPACTTANGCLTKVNQLGQASPLPSADSGWESEISLDLDAVSALCPNCHILLVEASSAADTDLDQALQTAAAMGANQISNSWSGNDSSPPAGTYTFPGIPVVFATGDHGYTGTTQDAYPAALPGVTAAGGTTLAPVNVGTGGRGYAESAWSLSGGWGVASGCDLQEPKPAYQLDTGCTGRAYADLSADADPNTGIQVFDSAGGGWAQYGGTSLSAPLIAAYYAITGVGAATPAWAYADSGLLNDPTGGSSGTCAPAIIYICDAGTGYDGPTGIGSISGAVVSGAPGVGGPTFGTGTNNTYLETVTSTAAMIKGGIYPNALDTHFWVQYGTTTAYGQQTTPVDLGQGQAPVTTLGVINGLSAATVYHYRLVAQNSLGTTYGYDYTLQTAGTGAPVNTAVPVITGATAQGQSLTASLGNWSPGGTSYTYQWLRDTGSGPQNVAGATKSTYVLGATDVGANLSVTVTATNAFGTASATSASAGPVGNGGPANVTPPVVTGTLRQGYVLAATFGTWNPPGTSYTYQWQRDTGSGLQNIAGAVSSQFQLGVADLGASLRVIVTASNSYAAPVSVASNEVGPVTSGAPANTTPPSITGTTREGQQLSAVFGTWNPSGASYTYQWQRDTGSGPQNIPGAIGTTYTPGTADLGANIDVIVTAINPFGQLSLTTSEVGPVTSGAPVNTSAPTIVGTAQRAAGLSVNYGSWTPVTNSFTVQWQRDSGSGFTNITGATAAKYVLATADEGANIRAQVTGINAYGSVTIDTSAVGPVVASPPVDSTPPIVSGTPQRTNVLSVAVGAWTGAGNSYSYQWQRNVGPGFQNIPGATSASYLLVAADEGATVRAVVTVTNADGTATASSAATPAIATAPPVNTAVPTITGAQRVGGTLTAAAGTWKPVGPNLSYDWQRGDPVNGYQDIANATGSSYTLQNADIGEQIRVIVTATNVDGSQSATSDATAAILAPPVATVPPALPTGTLMDSYTLTADPGTWNTAGVKLDFAWLRCPTGAIAVTASCIQTGLGQTYIVLGADVGHPMAVRVTATSTGGSTSATSPLTAPIQGRPLANVTLPTITGTPQVPLTVGATPGTWNVALTSISYTWDRCDADGVSNCGPVSAVSSIANAPGYALTTADRGHTLVLLVTASSPGHSVTAQSAPVTVQDQPLPVALSAPTVTGTAARASQLRATFGTWANNPSLTYAWMRCAPDGTGCQPIAGATGSSYLLAVPDEGSTITIQVTATNTSGSVVATATRTATVIATPPVNTHIPMILGTPQQGVTLRMANFTWQATADTNYSFSWERCAADGSGCQPIAGARSILYTPSASDVGHTLVAVASAYNPDASINVPSAASAVVLPLPISSSVLPAVAADPGRVGDVLTITPGTFSGSAAGNETTQWMRCTSYCAPVGSPDASGYTITAADVGAILRVRETATNAAGTATAWSSTYVGPVSSAASASAVLRAGPTALRSSSGVTIALASLSETPAFRAALARRGAARATTVVLRRARGVSGTIRAWACPVAGQRGGPPAACSRAIRLGAGATLRLPASVTGNVRVVVVRSSH